MASRLGISSGGINLRQNVAASLARMALLRSLPHNHHHAPPRLCAPAGIKAAAKPAMLWLAAA